MIEGGAVLVIGALRFKANPPLLLPLCCAPLPSGAEVFEKPPPPDIGRVLNDDTAVKFEEATAEATPKPGCCMVGTVVRMSVWLGTNGPLEREERKI